MEQNFKDIDNEKRILKPAPWLQGLVANLQQEEQVEEVKVEEIESIQEEK